jgi:hypothetical protein
MTLSFLHSVWIQNQQHVDNAKVFHQFKQYLCTLGLWVTSACLYGQPKKTFTYVNRVPGGFFK